MRVYEAVRPNSAPHSHRFPPPASDHVKTSTARLQNGQSTSADVRPMRGVKAYSPPCSRSSTVPACSPS